MVISELIEIIDGFLEELGTSSIVDARKARDQLMDLRLILMLETESLVVAVLEAETPDVPVS